MQGIEGIMQTPGSGFPAILAAVPLVLSAMLAPAHAETMHLLTNQGEREAIVLPSRQGPAPTILVLHGALSTALYTAENSDFTEVAAAHGFTAVFPQGIRKQWNDGREAQAAGVDDVGFLHRLVTALVGRGLTDPRQVYIAGISNGGMMTFRMLCEASELFAGAATVIANMPANVGARCAPRRPVPVVMFNGTADPLVPYDGGGVGFLGGRGSVWAAEETAEFMADVNACGAARAVPLPSSWNSRVHATRIEWTLCRSGSPVALYRFEGAGHQVPGQRQFLPLFLGRGTRALHAADEAFAFFHR
jgi:polyhydroxybutyrate depolymerase